MPELISILGVEVPDAPDVSLAEIRADAATVNWTRAPPNRSVQKFLIQVNGVVGELGPTSLTGPAGRVGLTISKQLARLPRTRNQPLSSAA